MDGRLNATGGGWEITGALGKRARTTECLFLIAPNERKVRIEVGLGLEDVLTNSIAKSIIDTQILPKFKNGNMQAGVVAGHRAIIQALGGEYEKKNWFENFFQFLLLPFFVLGRFLGFGGGRFSGGGGGFGGGGASGSW